MRRSSRLFLLAVLATTCAAGAGEQITRPRPETLACGQQVLRVHVPSLADLEWLASRTEPWEVDREAGVVVIEAGAELAAELVERGLWAEVDRAMTDELCMPRLPLKGQTSGIPGFPCYRTLAETFATAGRLVAEHPDLAELIDIGDSWEKLRGFGGHDLLVLRLTNRAVAGVGTPATPGRKPVLFVMAAVHAREYTTAETLTRFAEAMLAGYGSDPDATWILDEHELHLLLQANPDGRVRAEQGLSWRKNADNDHCSNTDNRGVDLNRNFPYQWGCCNGSSTNPCALTYRGPGAASEPETIAIQDYLRLLVPRQWTPEPPADATGVFLDLHSYGQLVLWPWGSTREVAPNGRALETMGRRMAYLNNATPAQSINLYPTDGTTEEFAYGDLGLAAFTVEIGYRFFEPCTVFEGALVTRMLALLRWSAKVVRAPYLLPAGPEILDLTLAPNAIGAGGAVALRAVADDRRLVLGPGASVSAIRRAEAFVGVPPWTPGAVPMALTLRPDPGGSHRATVEGVLDTGGMAGGRHLVYVHAEDDEGNWGPVSAVFLEIESYPTGPRPGGRRFGG